MRSALQRFVADDRGQDLIEYALLTAVIGFSSVAVFDVLRTAIGATYDSWETATNDLWEPPDPIGGGS